TEECDLPGDVDRVCVLRIGEDTRVILGASVQRAAGIRARPRRAAILGPIQSTVVMFDEGVDEILLRARRRDTDLADAAHGQPGVARELTPCAAAVATLEDAAAGAAAVRLPRAPPHLPECGVEDACVLGIDGEIDAAALVVAIEDAFPALATIGRAKDAALRIRSPRVAERGDVDTVAVGWIHANARDGLLSGAGS